MSNWLEDLIAEGWEQGREEGREALQRNLLRILHHRFGDVPEALPAQLQAFDLTALEGLANVALEVDSYNAFTQHLDQMR